MQKKTRRRVTRVSARRRPMPRGQIAGRVTVALLIVGALVYVFAAGQLGSFLADKVFTPILGTGQPTGTTYAAGTPAPSMATVSPSASASPSGGDNVVRDISFPQLEYHALQMGAFSTLEAAQQEAEDIQALGGAGYIVQDVRYRVLANVYLSGDDARTVKKNLLETQGVDSYVYSGNVGVLELTVTAPQARIDAIVSGYDAWKRMLTLLSQVSDLVDRGEMTAAEGAQELLLQCDKLDAAEAALTAGAQVEDDSSVLSGLADLIDNTGKNIRVFCEKNVVDSVAFSAQIKYNYIEAVFSYKSYIEGISASMI